MKALLIRKPGPFTTVQDAGRPGLRRYGIPPSGALDQFSYQVANALVGNPLTVAALEILLPGLVVEALTDCVVAITGGDLDPQPAPMWTSFVLHRGEQIAFKKRQTGCRAYLAIRGGISTEKFLGSMSTFTKGRMGRPLQAGDTVSTADSLSRRFVATRYLPVDWRPATPAQQIVRVTRGPQAEAFTARGHDTFLQSVYTISPRSDRQGLRTEGPPIEFVNGPDIISDPTPLGAIQVPGDGKPIILHRDGQVTGGYAKIATVASADLDKFGQMLAGDELRFQIVSREEALALASQARQRLNVVITLLGE